MEVTAAPEANGLFFGGEESLLLALEYGRGLDFVSSFCRGFETWLKLICSDGKIFAYLGLLVAWEGNTSREALLSTNPPDPGDVDHLEASFPFGRPRLLEGLRCFLLAILSFHLMVEFVLPGNIFPSRASLSRVCALDRIPSGPKALGTFGDFPSWPPAAEEQEKGKGEDRWAVATQDSSQGLVYDWEVEE